MNYYGVKMFDREQARFILLKLLESEYDIETALIELERIWPDEKKELDNQ